MDHLRCSLLTISVTLAALLLGACSGSNTVSSPVAPPSTPPASSEPFPTGLLLSCPDCGAGLLGYTAVYGADGTLSVSYLGEEQLSGRWDLEGHIMVTGDTRCHDEETMPAAYAWHFDGESLAWEMIDDHCTDRIDRMDGRLWKVVGASAFPFGIYTAAGGAYLLELDADFTFTFSEDGSVASEGTFSVDGEVFALSTDSYCDHRGAGSAAYTWILVDDLLSFQVIGKDNCSDRLEVLQVPYRLKERISAAILPIGTYTAENGDGILELGANTFTFTSKDGDYHSSGTYATDDFEITWETDSYCDQSDLRPVTYLWTLDDDALSFHAIGRDACLARAIALLPAFHRER